MYIEERCPNKRRIITSSFYLALLKQIYQTKYQKFTEKDHLILKIKQTNHAAPEMSRDLYIHKSWF